MNLTYELKDGGYVILNNGKAWIVQDSYIPYPAETIEASAQLHIDALIEEANAPQPIPVEEEIAQLKADLATANEAIMQILFGEMPA